MAITTAAWQKANHIYQMILSNFNIYPSRIKNSIEGGIALVYSYKKGFLKKHYHEFFIEIYNDSTVVYSLTDNYNANKTATFFKDDNFLEDFSFFINY